MSLFFETERKNPKRHSRVYYRGIEMPVSLVNKVEKIEREYAHDKKLLVMKLWGIAIKLFPSSPMQGYVDSVMRKYQ